MDISHIEAGPLVAPTNTTLNPFFTLLRKASESHPHSDGGEGAIWCAQRVEDNEFVVVANMMVIRQVDLADLQVYARKKISRHRPVVRV